MPFRQSKKYSSGSPQRFEIKQPGIGGINLKDLEFEQEANQSPYMLNMMYRNGSFSKRYGQEVYKTFEDTIYAVTTFNGKLLVHSGTKIYIDDVALEDVEVPAKKGIFMKFYLMLYYLVDSKFYQYGRELDEETSTYIYKWKEVEPYVPTLFNGAEPGAVVKTASEGESGFGGYAQDDYNLLSNKAIELYNGDGSSKAYYIKGLTEYYDWSVTPTIKINDVETTAFTLDKTNGVVNFTTAPAKGYDNVEITWTLLDSALKQDRDRLLGSKYSVSYGNSNNARLFLAGGGDSKYFYSAAYDATYWPEPNWEIIGRTEDDITGFGLQYNTLFIFKPNELYSIGSYTSTTTDEDTGTTTTSEYFVSQLVNAEKGCDAPYSIQLIDNKLTWFSSRFGICTMVSSNILDERNIRIISRNIEKTNNFSVKGIMDYDEDLNTIQSADFDNKYFLVFPSSGMCYMWDYQISPYYYTSSKETDTKVLDFFLFNKFHVEQFIRIPRESGNGEELAYISSEEGYTNKLIKLNDTFRDYDGNAIYSYYMTPYLTLNAIDYLKTIKNIYFQVRGDTNPVLNIYYLTEETSKPNEEGNREQESIILGGSLWAKFDWSTFEWSMASVANVYRRRCMIKKVQMCAFYIENNQVNRDMNISDLILDYILPKKVK